MKKCPEYMDRKVFEFGTENEGPGPAAYGARTTVGRLNRLPTVAGAPACSMHQRLDLGNETEGPGPAVYNLAQLTYRGRAVAPRYSIAKKLPFDGDIDSPGPAAYKPRVPVKGPVPKMLFRINNPDPDYDYPPILVVHPPLKIGVAAATPNTWVRRHCVNPGSNVSKFPSTLSRKKITMAKKIDEIIDIKSPGPPAGIQSHAQVQVYKVMPNFSFGMWRPEKFPPLVVCGDDVKIKK
ncbi:unnamed protein product [Macrosiphum euphorbiae]|uniref:Uncharacterized protein n=1 Tax=Macrosiphum euphorbiae TaxID=13131 RepID=A0AAV0XJQ9_9HEMI|nr:unnamed protein product [Macrosiphum euphorbiae]